MWKEQCSLQVWFLFLGRDKQYDLLFLQVLTTMLSVTSRSYGHLRNAGKPHDRCVWLPTLTTLCYSAGSPDRACCLGSYMLWSYHWHCRTAQCHVNRFLHCWRVITDLGVHLTSHFSPDQLHVNRHVHVQCVVQPWHHSRILSHCRFFGRSATPAHG